jgi:UDP-N-acetyl-D-glucosamine dehydrogenase
MIGTHVSLEQRLLDGDAVFGVVGLGYVGLPLAAEMAAAGNKVIGFDVSTEKVGIVNDGRSYIPDIPSERIGPLVASGLIVATTDFSRAAECDCIAICVPTPLDRMKEPDITFMVQATESIAPFIKRGTLVTLESTTYPGTTDEVIKPILEAQGHTIGTDVFLAFSPERVDPGNVSFQTKNTPKVVGGHTPECTKMAVMFYERFLDSIVPVSSTKTAEMAKLLENIYRCVNIALVNELLQLCDRMDINMWEVVDAAKTKPFGFMPFYPGPGLGGHCIPIDPFYLSWKAREYDFRTKFIELAGEVNEDMPYWVVSRLATALNSHGKAFKGSSVLVLGAAYKKDIDDMRESPAVKVMEILAGTGAVLSYHDPFVPRSKHNELEMSSVELTAGALAAADVVVILTDHTVVDYDLVADHASLVLDTRNALKGRTEPHIVRL